VRRALAGFRQIGPVIPLVRVDGQVEHQAIHGRRCHSDFPARDERPDLHAELHALETREWLVAEAGRVAQRDVLHRHRQPRKKLQTHLALDREITSGFFLDDPLDIIAEVARVEEQDERDRRDGEKAGYHGNDDCQDLRKTHDWSTL